MKEVAINSIDLTKNVFQLHGAVADGTVFFRKKLSRPQFQRFMSEQPRWVVAMEASGGAHHWAREMELAGLPISKRGRPPASPFWLRFRNTRR